MTALVSVVIPTYNRAADVRRALASVVRQTCAEWEAVVVDNHSSDDTREVVEGFRDPRIRFVLVRNEGVIATSRNLGASLSAGRYLAFLDSDDWWAPTKLMESVNRCEAGADVVYHDLYVARSRDQRLFWRRRRTRALRTPVFEDLRLRGNAICTSSVVVRRQVFMDSGGFSEDPLRIAWEDYDAWLRIAQVTERFERIAQPLGYYWVGGGNMSSPERTLAIYPRVRELYFQEQAGRTDMPLPGWYHYGLGMAHYALGHYQASLPHLRQAVHGDLPARLRLLATTALVAAGARMLAARPQPRD